MASLFRGKFLDELKTLYYDGMLSFPHSCEDIAQPSARNSFIDKLYLKEWCPFIKETFNGFGNTITYLGKYTHKIAITNSRIKSVSENEVTYTAKNYKTGKTEDVTCSCSEFIRRFLQHVLPKGFQKIRYYGLLSGCVKKRNLKIVFDLQGRQQFKSFLKGLSTAEIILKVWKYDIHKCSSCGSTRLRTWPQIE